MTEIDQYITPIHSDNEDELMTPEQLTELDKGIDEYLKNLDKELFGENFDVDETGSIIDGSQKYLKTADRKKYDKEYNKKYYEKRKQINDTLVCTTCGGKYNKYSLDNHQKTKKHIFCDSLNRK
jgi:hypothetical protein